jgi:PAS domain S-box-containing protein
VEALSDRTLRDLLDHADAAVTVFTADRRFLAVNDRYVELTGYSREEVLTHRAGETLRLDPLDRERFLEAITSDISAGEADIRLKSGESVAVEFVVIPTRIDDAEAFLGLMWPLVDGHKRPSARIES